MKLTVIFRNDAPMVHCGDCPSYRSVQIELTPEQATAIKPQYTDSVGGHDNHETISRCFLEKVPRELSQAIKEVRGES